MRTLIPALAGAVLSLASVTTPLIAQNHQVALGLYGGASQFGDLTPVDPDETKLDRGWVAGIQFERWHSDSRFGMRFDASYADRALTTHNQEGFRIISSDLSVLVRLLRPEPNRSVAPYLAVGGGMQFFSAHDGGGPHANFYDDPAIKPIATLTLGTDFAPSRTLGLRIEVADQFLLPSPFGYPDRDRNFRSSHHPVLRAALQLRALPSTPTLARVAATPPEPSRTIPASDTENVPTTTDRLRTTADSLRTVADARKTEIQRLRQTIHQLERSLQEPARTEQAPAQPPATSPTRTAAQLAAARYLTVQIGAYRTMADAQRAIELVRNAGIPTWISQAQVRGKTYYRVRMGAFQHYTDAVQLTRRIRANYGIEPWIARIETTDPVPDNVVETTRASLPSR